MVQKNVAYRKSAAGADALATRDAALSMQLRSLLILVDGKRSADELAWLSASPAKTQQPFSHLLELGMIEPLPTPSAAVASFAAPAGPASSPARIVTLAEAQRAAVRGLTNLLSPTADDCACASRARVPRRTCSGRDQARGTCRAYGAQRAGRRLHVRHAGPSPRLSQPPQAGTRRRRSARLASTVTTVPRPTPNTPAHAGRMPNHCGPGLSRPSAARTAAAFATM